MTKAATPPPVLELADIAEIELFVLKRMREVTLGDHASVFTGAGHNFVGLRDWIPGDRLSSIDWAQSSLNNFSPLITREFEQPSTATIFAVADASASTRCGMGGTTIAAAIARSVAAVGLSAVLFQDMFGLIAFDDQCRQVVAARARIGKPHVLHCLDLYQQAAASADHADTLVVSIESHLRKTTLIPVISDFLFPGAEDFIRELSRLNAAHDVFLVMADARFAYELPASSAGWTRVLDVESGATRIVSRRELAGLVDRIAAWQERIVRVARDRDLDIVTVGLDRWAMETTLAEFAAERRLRKV